MSSLASKQFLLDPPLLARNAPPISKAPSNKAPAPTEAPANMAFFRLVFRVSRALSSVINGSTEVIDSTGVDRLMLAKLCFKRDPMLCERFTGLMLKFCKTELCLTSSLKQRERKLG